jgi:hypothetical protein
MKNYNSYQRLILILNVLIFIFGNIFILVYSLSFEKPPADNQIRSLNNLIRRIPANGDIFQSEILNINFDEEKTLDSGIVYQQKGDYFFVISTPARFSITSNDVFFISSGTMLIKNEYSTFFSFGRTKFNLLPNSLAVIDAEALSVYIYDGSIISEDTTASAGEMLYWNVDSFASKSFDRSDIANIADFEKIKFASSQIKKQVDEVFDLTPPVLFDINIEDKLVTVSDVLSIKARSEIGAEVFINGQSVKVDDNGKFVNNIELTMGDNVIDVLLVDRFKQFITYRYNITRVEAQTIEIPLSSPI